METDIGMASKEHHDKSAIYQDFAKLKRDESDLATTNSNSEDVYLTVTDMDSLCPPSAVPVSIKNNDHDYRRLTSSMPEMAHLIKTRLFPPSRSVSRQSSALFQGSETGNASRLEIHNDTHHMADSPPPARRRLRNRLLQQDGDYNISMTHVYHSVQKYYSDMWTTLIEVKWRWALLAFAMSFTLSWLLFSVIYFCIMYAHGDFERTSEWKSCIVSVDSFAAVFLFSLETQMTIGYGFRYPSDECPEVMYTICLQSMCGIVIQTLLVGVVFAKLVKPQNRAHTIQFSRCGVISLRERRLCFMFRVGDLRKTHLASIDLRVFMIRKHVTAEGEVLPFHIREIKCKTGDVDGCPMLTWPVIVCHTIDKESPLYEFSRTDLLTAKFEIHVVLDGVTPTNGMSTTVRTSYLPAEIHWGCRLDGLMTYQTEQGEYRIDYSKFHCMHPVWTPSCSARQLEETFNAGVSTEAVLEEMRKKDPNDTQTPIDCMIHHTIRTCV